LKKSGITDAVTVNGCRTNERANALERVADGSPASLYIAPNLCVPEPLNIYFW